MTFAELVKRTQEAAFHKSQLQAQLETGEAKLTTLTQIMQAQELAQLLIQQTAKETQDQLRYNLQDLVQSALDAVFPGQYMFSLSFDLKRGRTECEICLDKDGERMNPLDSNGGGIVDLVAFALRVAVWAIGTTRNVLILDEPFKFISAGYKPTAIEILKSLTQRLKLQVIMVTHDTDIIASADRIFHVDQKRRKSIVTQKEGDLCY